MQIIWLPNYLAIGKNLYKVFMMLPILQKFPKFENIKSNLNELYYILCQFYISHQKVIAFYISITFHVIIAIYSNTMMTSAELCKSASLKYSSSTR